MRFRMILALSLACAAGATSLPARADDGHEQAREALQRGEIRPLDEILAKVRREIPGEIIEVEFEREHGIWQYEIKAIDPSGRRMKIYVDASQNIVLKVKRK